MLAGYAASKGVPAAKAGVIVSGLMMIFGGLGIVLWMWVACSVALIVLFLLVATFKMHAFWKDTDPTTRMNNYINFSKNIALIGAALAFLFIVV